MRLQTELEASLATLEQQRLAFAAERAELMQKLEPLAPPAEKTESSEKDQRRTRIAALNRRGAVLLDQGCLIGRAHLAPMIADGVLAEGVAEELLEDLRGALGLQLAADYSGTLDHTEEHLDAVAADLDGHVTAALQFLLEELDEAGMLPRG